MHATSYSVGESPHGGAQKPRHVREAAILDTQPAQASRENHPAKTNQPAVT